MLGKKVAPGAANAGDGEKCCGCHDCTSNHPQGQADPIHNDVSRAAELVQEAVELLQAHGPEAPRRVLYLAIKLQRAVHVLREVEQEQRYRAARAAARELQF